MLAYSEAVHRSALMLKIMIITNYHDAELQPHNLSHGVAWTLFSVAPSNDNIVLNLHNPRTPFLEPYLQRMLRLGRERQNMDQQNSWRTAHSEPIMTVNFPSCNKSQFETDLHSTCLSCTMTDISPRIMGAAGDVDASEM